MMLARAWLDDLKIHDVDDSSCPISLRSANLGSGPDPRVSSEGKPSADGSINRTRFYGPRMVELVGWVHEKTPWDSTTTLTILRGAFRLRQEHTLRFVPLGTTREFFCTVVPNSGLDAPVEGWREILHWAIALESPDPRYYGSELRSTAYEPGGVIDPYGPGLKINKLALPLVFTMSGSVGTPHALAAWNSGTFDTPVILTLAGPASGVTAITNQSTGEKIKLATIALAAGDLLVVDTGKRTITRNGVPAPELIDAAHNVWFYLQPGDNELVVEGTGFTLGQTQLAATYRDAYI